MMYFEETTRILTEALQSVREEEFSALEKACINTLEGGGKIILSGLGKNVPICDKFVGTLTSMGLSASFMHTNSAVHGDLGQVKSNDLVIVLTKSGETLESVYLVDLLLKRECDLWLLSFSRESRLYEKIPQRVILSLEQEGDLWNVLPNHSTTLNLIVLQELAMNLIKKMEIPLDVLKANHPGGAIGIQLEKRD